jgi:hypothetical protein
MFANAQQVKTCTQEERDFIAEANEYFDFEGMKFDSEGNEMETCEEVEKKAIQFLSDK